MPHSRYEIYFHLIWHTKNNLPYLANGIERLVYDHVKITCKEKNIELLAIGGNEIHIHVLIQCKKWVSIPELMWKIKGKSSFDIKKIANLNLEWQKGYAIHTVSKQELKKLIFYVENQKTHHRI